MRELGRELEIVCFDEPFRPRYLHESSITCVKQPEVLMGCEAVRIVHEHVLGEKNGIEVRRLEAPLVQAQLAIS